MENLSPNQQILWSAQLPLRHRERAAYHEAGHAALALIQRIPVLSVELGEGNSGGECSWYRQIYPTMPITDRVSRIAIVLAGTLVERLVTNEDTLSDDGKAIIARIDDAIRSGGDTTADTFQGWVLDALQARIWAGGQQVAPPNQVLIAAWRLAEKLLCLHSNLVEALALELLSRPRLEAHQVNAIYREYELASKTT